MSAQVHRGYARRFILIGAVFLFAGATTTVFAQPREFSREQLISAAKEIMNAARYCALITTDDRGTTNARTMDAFSPESDMTVWFGTNPLSRKVAEVRRHPRVTLFYFDRENQAYVSLQGIARVVNDPQEKQRHWKDEWKDFYPDRNRSYILIAVRPVRLEVVNVKTGIVGAGRDWQPPTVIFSTGKRKHK